MEEQEGVTVCLLSSREQTIHERDTMGEYTEDKREAETILRAHCLGSEMVGVRWFGGRFFIEIEQVKAERFGMANPDLLLTVEARWTVFPERPDRFPEHEEDHPDMLLEERVATLARLAGQQIVSVRLGEKHSHLMLTFESGSLFFLNGYHHLYESWTLSARNDDWMIVSLPGSGIAIWPPQR